jgi:hypothetical protein
MRAKLHIEVGQRGGNDLKVAGRYCAERRVELILIKTRNLLRNLCGFLRYSMIGLDNLSKF